MSRFYNKKAWQRLRLAKLRESAICEYCRQTLATEVDHRVPIARGGDPWAWENLRSTCRECHSRKTRNIDVLGKDHVPVRGVDATSGLPLDPLHWWQRG